MDVYALGDAQAPTLNPRHEDSQDQEPDNGVAPIDPNDGWNPMAGVSLARPDELRGDEAPVDPVDPVHHYIPTETRAITTDLPGLKEALDHLHVDLRHNTRSCRTEIQEPDGWQDLDDRREALLRALIEDTCRARGPDGEFGPVSFSDARWKQVVLAYEATHCADPFVDWLAQLPEWDGVERCVGLFVNTLMAADTPVTRAAAKAFLVAAVARALQPGAKHDVVPILVSREQGIGKSSLGRGLFPPQFQADWYAEGVMLEPRAKDNLDQVLGCVIAEFAEFGALSGDALLRLKSFISTSVDRVRLSYAHRGQGIPRAFVPIATANDAGKGILPDDPTGNRRWVAIQCHAPRGHQPRVLRYLDQHREQIWAEALFRYRRGESWDITPELYDAWDAQNAGQTMRDDALEDTLADVEARLAQSPAPTEPMNLRRINELLGGNPKDLPPDKRAGAHGVDLGTRSQRDRLQGVLIGRGWTRRQEAPRQTGYWTPPVLISEAPGGKTPPTSEQDG